MTCAELMEILRQRPPQAPVYVWDSVRSFSETQLVSEPAGEQPAHASRRKLPAGAVVVWGKL